MGRGVWKAVRVFDVGHKTDDRSIIGGITIRTTK
jgi:hypothetical protein